MKKNVLGSVLGIALAAVLALGNGMAVRAEGADPSYSFNKVYKLAGDCQDGAVSPEETFIFDNGTDTGAEANVAKLYAVSHTKYNDRNQPDARTELANLSTENPNKIPEAVKTITIGKAEYAQGAVTDKTGATRKVTVTVPDATSYGSVGYYYYQFKETTGTTAGVTYDTAVKAFRVAVINGENGLEISSVLFYTGTDANTNTKTDNVTNEYSAGTLAITKKVTGNMGDKTKEFTVNVTFKAPENKEIKAPINIAITGDITTNRNTATIADGNDTASATITVKDGTTVTFTNIPKGVTYTVVETPAEGYTASYTATANNGNVDNTTGVTGTITTENNNADYMEQTVTITNNKGIDIDTGIFVSNLPYLLALAGIAAAALLFFAGKKRHSGED